MLKKRKTFRFGYTNFFLFVYNHLAAPINWHMFHVELQYFEKKKWERMLISKYIYQNLIKLTFLQIKKQAFKSDVFAALAKMVLLYFSTDVNDKVTRTHL